MAHQAAMMTSPQSTQGAAVGHGVQASLAEAHHDLRLLRDGEPQAMVRGLVIIVGRDALASKPRSDALSRPRRSSPKWPKGPVPCAKSASEGAKPDLTATWRPTSHHLVIRFSRKLLAVSACQAGPKRHAQTLAK